MNADNLLLVKIGYEYPAAQIKQIEKNNFYLHINKKADDGEKKIMSKLLKFNHHASGETLISALWAGLLCRLSYSREIQIGILTNKKHAHNTLFSIDEQTTLQQAGEIIQTQQNESTTNSPIDQCRYVISFQQSKEIIENQFNVNNTVLILNICESEITLFFSPAHIHKNNVEKIMHYFKRLLKNASLHKPLSQMQFISKEEIHRLKFLSRHHHVNEPNHWIEKSICYHFKQQVKKNINKMAVKDAINSYTFLELDALSDNLAHTLKKLNIKKGDYVAAIIERNANLLVVMLAIFKLGAAIIPINEKYPNDRIESILDNALPKLVIVNDNNRIDKKYAHLKWDSEILNESIHAYSSSNEILQFEDEVNSIAYIIYTSGTTGNPKGVPICQRGLLNLTHWYQTHLKMSVHDRTSQFASQAFDTFFCETVPSLLLGSSVHIIDDVSKLNPITLFDWLKKEKISVCDLPTAYAVTLFNLSWPELPNLRLVKIGGEAINQYPNQNFSFDIWNTYGPSETTIEAAYFKIHSANQIAHVSSNSPPIGRPIAGNEFYIVDPFMQPVPEGIQGELLIHSPGQSPGYINHHELTAEKFVPYKFESEDKSVYRSGDIVRWQDDGNLEFLGRVDQQVKIRGFRIELNEIEHALNQLPDVQKALVVPKNHDLEKKLAGYIIPNLDTMRFPFQERALLTLQTQKFEIMTDDISKSGIGIFGINKFVPLGSKVHIQIKLPGMYQSSELNGTLIWQRESRCGIEFNLTEEEKKNLHQSINYYLSTQNNNELILKTMTKRNLKLALKRKLPDYMIPDSMQPLNEFPLNFNGKIDTKALPDIQDIFVENKKIILPITPIEEKIIALWKKILKTDDVSLNDHFFQIGGNSLLSAQLTVAVLQEFNVVLPNKIIFDMPFIPIMAEFIQSHLDHKHSTHSSSIHHEFTHEYKKDLHLPDNIQLSNHWGKPLTQAEHILLTGCSGFLGVHLLNELLKMTSAKIYCFVRANEFETTATRMSQTLQKFGLEQEISLNNRRIILVNSDIAKPHFNIAEDFYQTLSEKIDVIYHCGAQVNTMTSYQQLRKSNVIGTLEIIKFAVLKKNKPIHYISTLSSAYIKNSNGLLSETRPLSSQEELTGGYAISKWVAELLLTQLNHRGLSTTIYRSGYIAGDSKTGISNSNDALLLLIKGCIQMEQAPKWLENITLLPVDVVSKAIVAISLTPDSTNNVFHIDHPKGMKWCDLVKWLNNFGFKIKLVSMENWQEKLKTIDSNNVLYPFIPYYLSLKANDHSAPVSTEHTQPILTQCNIIYPEINDELLSLYINQLINCKFLPGITRKKTKEIS